MLEQHLTSQSSSQSYRIHRRGTPRSSHRVSRQGRWRGNLVSSEHPLPLERQVQSGEVTGSRVQPPSGMQQKWQAYYLGQRNVVVMRPRHSRDDSRSL